MRTARVVAPKLFLKDTVVSVILEYLSSTTYQYGRNVTYPANLDWTIFSWRCAIRFLWDLVTFEIVAVNCAHGIEKTVRKTDSDVCHIRVWYSVLIEWQRGSMVCRGTTRKCVHVLLMETKNEVGDSHVNVSVKKFLRWMVSSNGNQMSWYYQQNQVLFLQAVIELGLIFNVHEFTDK